jgi:hypothetical protein
MVETFDLLRRNRVQVAAIDIVLVIVVGVFAYVAGYFTPRRLSASRIGCDGGPCSRCGEKRAGDANAFHMGSAESLMRCRRRGRFSEAAGDWNGKTTEYRRR